MQAPNINLPASFAEIKEVVVPASTMLSKSAFHFSFLAGTARKERPWGDTLAAAAMLSDEDLVQMNMPVLQRRLLLARLAPHKAAVPQKKRKRDDGGGDRDSATRDVVDLSNDTTAGCD